ncbi:hypothetical protein [Streptomyces sp. WA6-1-16]|uniref:hypothetical protein n=1 Tax=Streptomyces TaxID=1883 RepID=UPI00081E8347|nr:hypothetical protein [Streptomyces sp. WA6-1-16]SCF78926.1 hypothetical protein GA0115280_11249 [Streptomyces sp. Cmuel-A718b]
MVDTVLRTLGGEAFRTTVADGGSDRSKPFPDLYPKAAGCRVPAVPTAAPIAPAQGRRVQAHLTALLREWGRKSGYDVTS